MNTYLFEQKVNISHTNTYDPATHDFCNIILQYNMINIKQETLSLPLNSHRDPIQSRLACRTANSHYKSTESQSLIRSFDFFLSNT